MIFGIVRRNCNFEEKEIVIQLGLDPRSYGRWSQVLTTESPSPGIVCLNLFVGFLCVVSTTDHLAWPVRRSLNLWGA